jgi:hypothetical protein
MSGGVLAEMRPDPGHRRRPARRAATSGSGSPGAWHARAAWATMPGWLVMSAGPGCCGWPCPFWTGPGPRGGRRAPAAAPGRVDERCWLRAGGVGPGHRSADPGRGATEQAAEYSAAATGGGVARACRHGPGCRRDADPRGPPPRAPPIAGRPRVQGHGHPLYRLASTVVGMVLGVWWGLRWPRRRSVLAIAGVAPAAVIDVPWVARAVQRRRPRMAAGWALVAAGSVARLRAASAEPLR